MRKKLCEPAGRGKEKSAWVLFCLLSPRNYFRENSKMLMCGEGKKNKRCPEVQIKLKIKNKGDGRKCNYLFALIYVSAEAESCQIAPFRQLGVTVGNRSMYGSKSRKAQIS